MKKCTNCGASINDEAKFCDYCGTRQNQQQEPIEVTAQEINPAPPNSNFGYVPPSPFYTKNWFIWVCLILFCPLGIFLMYRYTDYKKQTKLIISAAVIIFTIIALTSGGDKASSDSASNSSGSTGTSSSVSTQTNDEKAQKLYNEAMTAFNNESYDTAINKLNTLIATYPDTAVITDAQALLASAQTEKAKPGWITAGMYKVGTDIPAGEYVLLCTGSSAYFEIASDSTGNLSSIIANDNISTHTYVTVKDGQYFEFKNSKVRLAEYVDAFSAESGAYEEGMYKVGVDIPAGEYKIAATSDYGYFEVDKDSNNTLSSIITNDNFSGEKYITIKTGQYLKMSNCKLLAN